MNAKKSFGAAGDPPEPPEQRRSRLIAVVPQSASHVGTQAACAALGIPKASYYRRKRSSTGVDDTKPRSRAKPQRSLSNQERLAILDVLHQERFIDQTPYEIYATLLDEGVYLCSIPKMYRILHSEKEVRERRKVARHAGYKKPELIAESPNRVWSWDITKLKGPVTWTYFYLYVIIDIFSRRVVGWFVADHENAAMFQEVFQAAVVNHDVPSGQLTLHADRGAPMIAKTTGQFLADLGVTKSHSRPYTSNDNPFSESQFKTLKYQPEFPERFGCLEDARTFCRHYFDWYNAEHHHTGIGLMTPNQVHYGQADDIYTARQAILHQAFARTPERFVKRPPTPPAKPTMVWINPPKSHNRPKETDQNTKGQIN